ncbi:hypothetical protein G4B88_014228 [Cannabis sativa]|uniref:Uncharacterized protein n=1 Tax=Cannabis sativa TaxID=3483 RepID=A0A7J6EWU0_CANSA|nr:hypothetical protein G4B88_014228 [Cannabis sativa]
MEERPENQALKDGYDKRAVRESHPELLNVDHLDGVGARFFSIGWKSMGGEFASAEESLEFIWVYVGGFSGYEYGKIEKENENGANTRVFKDPWIPRPPSFKPITKEVGDLMMVSELIEQPGQWNKDLIHQVFSTLDSQLILSIPITLFEYDDDWLWHFTSHGHYSVKSGYNNLAIGGENLQPSSSNEVMAAWWSSY